MQEAHQAWLGPSRDAKSQAVSDLQGVVGFGRWHKTVGGLPRLCTSGDSQIEHHGKAQRVPQGLDAASI